MTTENTNDEKQASSEYMVNALRIAMSFYDVLVMDPRTAPAAFGVACYELREIMNLNLTAAIFIIRGELDRRELEVRNAMLRAPPDKT